MSVVLDSSSVLAVIDGEPGADAVGDVLMGASISAVNYSDEADRAYRDLVHFYVGGAYGGIRDRARVGIDDVRVRRQ